MILFLILIFLREPNYFINSRIWAEEGTIYLNDAMKYGWSSFLHSNLGYYSFYNKLASLLTSELPKKYFSDSFLFFSILPMLSLFKVLFSLFEMNKLTYCKLMLFGIIVVYLPTYEIWLNTITSQFWLLVSALLILFLKIEGRFEKTLVLVSSLTGPFSIVYVPIYIFKKYKESGWKFNSILVFFNVALVVSVLIQFFSVVGIITGVSEVNELEQGGQRFFNFNLISLVKGFFGYYISYPFLGIYLSNFKFIYIFLTLLVFIAQLYFLYKIIKSIDSLFWLFIAGSCISFMTLFASIGGSGGLRYAFSWHIIFIFFLLNNQCNKSKILNLIRIILLSICMISITLDQNNRKSPYYNSDWAGWKKQLELSGPCNYDGIKIWPMNTEHVWNVKISKGC
tara:strand:- start:12668 stop:13855 length:1188 start_codon:yes stop_codon:yes gene_type:complete